MATKTNIKIPHNLIEHYETLSGGDFFTWKKELYFVTDGGDFFTSILTGETWDACHLSGESFDIVENIQIQVVLTV